ncbi:MAG TPA: hypothetical protein VK454_08490 [Myxococcaceae bacterium]|nr:hypothetical protein [Myxococcaceae bacterium]
MHPKSLALLLLLAATPALADERELTFTYDSGVLPPGSRELELWVTSRFGRPDGYTEFDNRAEFELGVVSQLQTAIYLNFSTTHEGPSGSNVQTWSVSNEWKWKLLDPVADPFGFALYGEVLLGVNEQELEGKLIFDKRIGPLLLALNLIGELGRESAFDGTVHEQVLEGTFGAAYRLGAGFSLGVEARLNCLWETGEGFVGGAFYIGPVVSFASGGVWAALSFLPQAVGFGPSTVGGLALEDQERFNIRLLVGFHL